MTLKQLLYYILQKIINSSQKISSTEFEPTPEDSEGRKPGMLQFMGSQSQTRLSDSTTAKDTII